MGIAMAMNGQSQSRGPQLAGEQPIPGRLRDHSVTSGERQLALWTHISLPIVAVLTSGILAFVAPLIIWLLRKDESPFNDDHGREALNFFISYMLLHILLGITMIGVVFYPVLWVIGLIATIRGAIAGHRGEYYRYPMTIRFLS